MTALLTLFWRLSIFRASPENVPYSSALLGLVFAAWCGLQLLVCNLQNALPVAVLFGSQLISLTVIMVGVFVLLFFKGIHNRWLQTALALLGVDLVLSLVGLPLLGLNAWSEQPLSFVEGLYLLLVSWQLAAQGFIYHRAMQVGPFLGPGIALCLLMVSYVAVVMVLPQVVAR